MFPRQNTLPVRSSDYLSHENMLGKNRDREATLSQRQSPGYIDEDELMSGVTMRRSSIVRFSSLNRENLDIQRSNVQPKASGIHMMSATYDGTIAWHDYHSHFEACADLNGLTEKSKGTYLAVSLRCKALGVLGNLLKGKTPKYGELVKVLEKRFAPPSQTELYRVQMK
jgi:hypothetical protein